MVESGRRVCLLVGGLRNEVVGSRVVEAGLAAGGIAAAGWAIAVLVGAVADAGLAIVAVALAVEQQPQVLPNALQWSAFFVIQLALNTADSIR